MQIKSDLCSVILEAPGIGTGELFLELVCLPPQPLGTLAIGKLVVS